MSDSKKNILILGAGLMQGPAIKAAKELGYKAVVIDANDKAVCVKDADRFEKIDLKDREAIASFALDLKSSQEGLAAIFTAGTDFSASVAYASEKCGLSSHSFEACLNASDKVRMRGCFKKAGVPSPEFSEVTEDKISQIESESENFPKVVKPCDNMGGRGCRLVREKHELKDAVLTACRNSRTKRAIFEDYMDGPEFSIDSLLYKGKLYITGFADRHIFYPPYFIEMGHTMPSTADEKIKRELIATFALGIKSLGLTSGACKADIKYTKDGPKIGEIAARLSGGYMSGWTYPYASGIFLTKEGLKIALGQEPDELIKNALPLAWQPHESVKGMEQPFELFEVKCEKTSAERAWLSIPGKIAKITGFDEAENIPFVKGLLPRSFEGDEVDFPRNNVSKCGNVITLAPTNEEAVSAAYDAIRKITLRLEAGNPATDKFLSGKTVSDEKGFPPDAFAISEEIRAQVEDFCKKNPEIPENSKTSEFLPLKIMEKIAALEDWNHVSLKSALEKFDAMTDRKMPLANSKLFFASLFRASIQGLLYQYDSGKLNCL